MASPLCAACSGSHRPARARIGRKRVKSASASRWRSSPSGAARSFRRALWPSIRARSKAWSAWPPRWRACLGLHVLAAVNDRAIVPGCDLTGDHAAVRAKLNEVYGLFAWEKIYIPAGFDHAGETLDLNTLLTPARLKKEYRLKSLTFGLSAKEWGVGIAVAALLAAIVGVYFIRAVQHRKARERAEHLR